jgi:hypothetical protein
VFVEVNYTGLSRLESAIFGSVARTNYSTGSSVSNISNGKQAVTLRNGGWLGAFTITFYVVDTKGNVQSSSASYTISGDNPAAPDATSPTVTLVSPLTGPLGKFTPLVVDIDDNSAVRFYVVYAYFDGIAPAELVYVSGHGSLQTNYDVTATVVADAQRLSIVRRTGWQLAPRLVVKVVDTSGNLLP